MDTPPRMYTNKSGQAVNFWRNAQTIAGVSCFLLAAYNWQGACYPESWLKKSAVATSAKAQAPNPGDLTSRVASGISTSSTRASTMPYTPLLPQPVIIPATQPSLYKRLTQWWNGTGKPKDPSDMTDSELFESGMKDFGVILKKGLRTGYDVTTSVGNAAYDITTHSAVGAGRWAYGKAGNVASAGWDLTTGVATKGWDLTTRTASTGWNATTRTASSGWETTKKSGSKVVDYVGKQSSKLGSRIMTGTPQLIEWGANKGSKAIGYIGSKAVDATEWTVGKVWDGTKWVAVGTWHGVSGAYNAVGNRVDKSLQRHGIRRHVGAMNQDQYQYRHYDDDNRDKVITHEYDADVKVKGRSSVKGYR